MRKYAYFQPPVKQKQVVEEFVNQWKWSRHEEWLVSKWIIGQSIHVCSGSSKLGDIQLDLTEYAHIRGDALHLPLKDKSIDTVISDPPWNIGFIGRYWKELKRVAKKRVIFMGLSKMRDGKDLHLIHSEVVGREYGFQIKALLVYDRKSQNITNYI